MVRKARGALLEDDVVTGTPAPPEAALVPMPGPSPAGRRGRAARRADRAARHEPRRRSRQARETARRCRSAPSPSVPRPSSGPRSPRSRASCRRSTRTARIVVEGKVRSTYATNEQLQEDRAADAPAAWLRADVPPHGHGEGHHRPRHPRACRRPHRVRRVQLAAGRRRADERHSADRLDALVRHALHHDCAAQHRQPRQE